MLLFFGPLSGCALIHPGNLYFISRSKHWRRKVWNRRGGPHLCNFLSRRHLLFRPPLFPTIVLNICFHSSQSNFTKRQYISSSIFAPTPKFDLSVSVVCFFSCLQARCASSNPWGPARAPRTLSRLQRPPGSGFTALLQMLPDGPTVTPIFTAGFTALFKVSHIFPQPAVAKGSAAFFARLLQSLNFRTVVLY